MRQPSTVLTVFFKRRVQESVEARQHGELLFSVNFSKVHTEADHFEDTCTSLQSFCLQSLFSLVKNSFQRVVLPSFALRVEQHNSQHLSLLLVCFPLMVVSLQVLNPVSQDLVHELL